MRIRAGALLAMACYFVVALHAGCAGGDDGDGTADSDGGRDASDPDVVDGAVAVTCATDPSLGSGPSDLVTIRYRAVAAVDPATLTLSASFFDAALAPVVATTSLIGR